MKIEVLDGTCLSYYLPGEKVLIDAGAYTGRPVKFLILTHCHFDHLTYAQRIIEEQKPQVFAGRGDVKSLKELDERVIPEFLFDRRPVIANPLKEGDEVQGLKVLETPGHTPGSICLLKEGYLFSGDTLFRAGFGRFDLPTGSYTALLESLDKLRKISYTRLMPGH